MTIAYIGKKYTKCIKYSNLREYTQCVYSDVVRNIIFSYYQTEKKNDII